ncbi:MFS transporter [Embleya hyalina]|uniref:MFS transporter n=1 Tax=Embleya hyalina TaxID=516124 RepID=UPI001C3F760A
MLAVDAVTFLVLAVTFLVLLPDVGATPPEDASRAAGFTAIRRNPTLLGLLTLSFGFFLLFGPVYVALPLYVSGALHGSAGLLAAFYSAFGVGALLGSFLTGFLRSRPRRPTAVAIVVGFGVFMLPIGLGAPTPVAIGAFAICGMLWPPYASLSTTLIQRSSPDALMPQVLAASSAVRVLSVPLGTALGGPLVGAFGADTTLWLAAGGITALGLLAAGASALRVRARPDAPSAVAAVAAVEETQS